ncbi:MAG: arginase family protein [Chthoniobacterales bacterium]|nr:arginase family protein [Chthoniobacterales bacterium]
MKANEGARLTWEDPNWPRASRWLSAEPPQHTNSAVSLAVLGIPMNSSSTPARFDLAPQAIRSALARYSLFDEDAAIDVGRLVVREFGDVTLSGAYSETNFSRTVGAIERARADADCLILLGGDNGITRAGVCALGVPLERCGILTFDAHHDLRDLDHGLTNGNPIRALLQDGVPGPQVVQIGIQPFANSFAYARVAHDAGISVATADDVYEEGIQKLVTRALAYLSEKTDAIYVDLDVDVLDRAFAPACPGSRPGGLQPWMVRQAARLCGQHERVRMMDIVEVDPTKDVADTTCLAAASFFLAFASGMLKRAVK